MATFRTVVCFLAFVSLLTSGPDERIEASEYTSRGMSAYSAGDYVMAIDLFKKAFELRPDYSALAYNISCCFALSNEKDSAIAWLQKTFELGCFLFLNDEDFVSLHADPRYQELLQEAEKNINELRMKEWEPLISLPEQYSRDRLFPVVIGLHGLGTSPGDFARAIDPAILEAGYILCCPYGPEIRGTTAFGWGEYTDAEKRVLEAVQSLMKEYAVDSTRAILLGFSQGGGMAFSIGLMHPEIFSAVISVAGYYSDELNEILEHKGPKGMSVYMMIGQSDFLIESNKTAERMMTEKGIRVNLVIYEGLGHAFPRNGKEEILKALHWIDATE